MLTPFQLTNILKEVEHVLNRWLSVDEVARVTRVIETGQHEPAQIIRVAHL